MPIEFPCPQCNKLLRVPDAAVGRQAQCPGCSTVSTVPAASVRSPVPAAPRQPPQAPPPPPPVPQPGYGSAPQSNPFAPPPPQGGAQAWGAPQQGQQLPDITNPYAAPTSFGPAANTWARPRPRLASLGQRFGGAVVDGVIGMLLAVPLIVLLFIAVVSMDNRREPNISAVAAILMLLLSLGLLALGVTQIILLSTSGQTIGKKVAGTRIVLKESGQTAGFVHAFLLRSFVFGLIGSAVGLIPFAGIVFNLVDICMIFGEERRCLHDLLAQTIVVEA
ncbi:MAG: RDD family protein [Planctomycetes bacterium]|nr:RDD family protein [Planctomycetota bacterium]